MDTSREAKITPKRGQQLADTGLPSRVLVVDTQNIEKKMFQSKIPGILLCFGLFILKRRVSGVIKYGVGTSAGEGVKTSGFLFPVLPTSTLFRVDPGSVNYLQERILSCYLQFNVKSASLFRTLQRGTKYASINCAKIKR